MSRKLFTPEQEAFIRENIKGLYASELTQKINDTFRTSFTVDQVKNYNSRNKLKSGVVAKFQKGSTAWNKGMKGLDTGGQSGWFKKGHVPHNHKPVGSERIEEGGYVYVKTEEPSTWRMKHVLLWEKHYGKLDKGDVLIFADGDQSNITIDNLIKIDRRQLGVMNKNGFIKDNAEMTKIGITLADIKIRVGELRRGGEK